MHHAESMAHEATFRVFANQVMYREKGATRNSYIIQRVSRDDRRIRSPWMNLKLFNVTPVLRGSSHGELPVNDSFKAQSNQPAVRLNRSTW